MISTGAPSRGVPGSPLLFAFSLSPCTSKSAPDPNRGEGKVKRRNHLVHPRPTVPLVPSENEPRRPVDVDVDVETSVGHLHVEVRAGVVLAEVDSRGMTLEDLLDDVRDRAGGGVRARVVEGDPFVGKGEATTARLLEDLEAFGSHRGVILDVLEHEPWAVAGVVPAGRKYHEEVQRKRRKQASSYLGVLPLS